MRDTESNLLKFVKIVERYPLLYFTPRHAELGHLWETVASAVRLEIREECTAEELKYKWKAMRRKYISNGDQLANGGRLRHQHQYDLYNTLAFLYPYAVERYPDLLKCPPPVSDTEEYRSKMKSKLKTFGKNKDTSADDHHSVGEPDDVGQSNRSDGLGQSTRSDDLVQSARSNHLGQSTGSGDLIQITDDGRTSIKTEPPWDETEDPTSSKISSKKYGNHKDTSAVDYILFSVPDNLGQSIKSDDIVQSTGSGDKGLSTEEFSTAIKAEALCDLTEDHASSDSESDMKPKVMERINLMKVENFPDGMQESTSFDVRETEGNLDLQFFRSILPDIANFTPQEKRKFRMGVLKLIDEIEENRK